MAALAGLAAVTGATCLSYSREMAATRKRVEAGSQVLPARHGPLEYAVSGQGPPVLVVHGAGGGYDQGALMVRAYGGDAGRWIIPSRFGYLRSALPADASTAAQADAFAELLDSLGVQRVAILAMSGGVPPSLQFAVRYPERTSALVLLSSAPYTPLTVANQELPVPIAVYHALFSSDFPFWLMTRVARTPVETMFDVTPALRPGLTPEDRAMVASMVASFQPVTRRMAGVRNEVAAIDPRARYALDEIRAPTLVVHAKDDHLNAYSVATHTAGHIAGAELMTLETGGHLLLGHHAEVRARVAAFLRQHSFGEDTTGKE